MHIAETTSKQGNIFYRSTLALELPESTRKSSTENPRRTEQTALTVIELVHAALEGKQLTDVKMTLSAYST